MYRNARTSFACARCYKRKKRCDRGYPSCSQCTKARAECIGLDRGSEAKLPRSLVTYLEDLVAQLELRQQGDTICDASLQTGVNHGTSLAPTSSASGLQQYPTAYVLAATTAQNSAPVTSTNATPAIALAYHRVFFMSAELPYPLAFQDNRPINMPSSHDGSELTRLPSEVADKLIAVYTERILPQYPVFLKNEVLDMYQRSKTQQVSPDEQFIMFLIKAITTLSSRSREYRKLISLAESLRRDAFACLNFDLTSSNATMATLQQLLLLAQYGLLFPSSTNLWHIIGDATKVALGLGMHQETPSQAGLDAAAVESRKRIFWTLYIIERSIAITAHRPFSIAGDQIHVSLPVSRHDQDTRDHASAQTSYLGFEHRVQFLRLQSEICSVNIGMRPIPSPALTHEAWMTEVEDRRDQIQAQVASSMSNFLQWQTELLLHMPCRRNPSPTEISILKCFDAATRIANGYWELAQLDQIDEPWHAVHHSYEAGNLILYSLWHFPTLIRRNYSTKRIFEIVHEISSFFILIVKHWPAAQHCGVLFDELRKGALNHFQEERSLTPGSSVQATQLRELIFRENADLLYARDQSLSTDQSLLSIIPDSEIQTLTLDFSTNLDYLDFFHFPETSDLDMIGMHDESGETFPEMDVIAESPGKPPISIIDEAQLNTALQRMPVCSHCKRRRIKCDMALPACRSCTKLQRECFFWDSALSQETSRKHIYALKKQVEQLLKESHVPGQEIEAINGTSLIDNGHSSETLDGSWNEHDTTFSRLPTQAILCESAKTDLSSSEMFFFGPTSAFARLATEAGCLPPMPVGSTIFLPRHQNLADIVLNSLSLNVLTHPAKSVAEDLASLYHRSIEICYPILGQNLIHRTLDEIFSADREVETDSANRTRFDLILAVALALLSRHEERLGIAADAYFREAVSQGILADLFIHPTNKSLQLVLLLCVYVWICPHVTDIWRLIGHATRMCLDIIEVHGSDKTDSAEAGILYRTLYSLETHIAIAFGRPRHLPDGTEVPASSPDPTLSSGDELSTLLYNLARLQNRFHRHMMTKEHDTLSSTSNLTVLDLSWMGTCVHDMKTWLGDWNARVESFFHNSSIFQDEEDDCVMSMLKCWGLFQQCQALEIAKQATDLQGQLLISEGDALISCKQLIEAATSLLHDQGMLSGFSPYPCFAFPFAWTHAHGVFSSALTVLRQLCSNSPLRDSEMERLVEVAVNLSTPGGCMSSPGTDGLATCLQNMYDIYHLTLAT